MKVVVTSPSWSLNGVNIFSANLVRGLRARGVDASILLTGVTYRERKPIPLPKNVPVERLKVPALATWGARRSELAKFLETRSPCIYLPNHDFLHSCIAPILSPRVGIVGVVHSDDQQHYDHASRIGNTWNATVAVSETIARRLREMPGTDLSRVSVIPYGVNARESFQPRAPEHTLRLIYAGRLDAQQKRVGDLVMLASELRRRGVRFSMSIVGEGPERSSLVRAIAAENLEPCVMLMPPVDNDDMVSAFAGYDAFVLPSAYEGLPIGLLEAMGQGCVPFATKIESGTPQLIRHGENGFMARVGDIGGFAELIENFAASPGARAQLSKEAWKTVSDSYTVEIMTQRYLEVFKKTEIEIETGSFRRSGSISRVRTSIRERVMAPLSVFHPAIRAQRK